MTTQLKSDTARVNGAKSHGPKTAEGRAKSSRNATKHGLSSRNPLVLECENDDDFQALHLNQTEIHQPATPAEKDLVDQMVAARWRILRLQSIETDLLDTEMRRKQERERERGRDDIIRLSHAYRSEVDNSRDGSCLPLRIPLHPHIPELLQDPPRAPGRPGKAIHPTRRG